MPTKLVVCAIAFFTATCGVMVAPLSASEVSGQTYSVRLFPEATVTWTFNPDGTLEDSSSEDEPIKWMQRGSRVELNGLLSIYASMLVEVETLISARCPRRATL